MRLSLGIKSDPVEYRYSYDWLFRLMEELDIHHVQLGSSLEFYHVEDSYFTDLRAAAAACGVSITSCFTAHRELGGFFAGDPRIEAVAKKNYRRWIEIAGLLGAQYVGSNPGAVYRDRMPNRGAGPAGDSADPAALSARFLEYFTELMAYAKTVGVAGLTIEPMSCAAEPPTLPAEITSYAEVTTGYHEARPESTVPAYFCGDISHAYVDGNRRVVHDHWELFELEIPYLAEFHFKNTDSLYQSTFGFGPAEKERGIIDLEKLKAILDRRSGDFPVDEVVGYLELGGPKLGRDYSDPLLRDQIVESIAAIRTVFPEL